jgi:hypothetical protein
MRHLARSFSEPINWVKGLICVLPFVTLFWLMPFQGRLTIGNDYAVYALQGQLELQYSLARGSFPLYAPGFAGGRSTAALTLGQLHHPLSHLAAHSPGYWRGYALEWNTFWRLVSLGLTHLVLFNLLRRLRLRTDLAFICSFSAVYNLRMLDMFRYGASLENYTAFLLLCAALAYAYLRPHRIAPLLWVIGATYLLICGGHPQMAYFGLIGAGIVALAVPKLISAIDPDFEFGGLPARPYYTRMGACLLAGLLLASAYVLPYYFEFLRDAPNRVGQAYSWSLMFSDNLIGALNSLFNPLRGDVHGSFGGAPLVVIAALAPFILLAPIRRVRGRSVITALWLTAAVIFLCSVGGDTPVFKLFWTYVPFARSFRVPGRIAMLLPLLLMFILAWFVVLADKHGPRPLGEPRWFAPWQIVALAMGLMVIWHALPANWTSAGGHYTPLSIGKYPAWVDGLLFWTGLGCLLLAAVRVSGTRNRALVAASGISIAVLMVVHAAAMCRYGTWIANRSASTTLAQMDTSKRADLAFRGWLGDGLESSAAIKPAAGPSWFVSFRRAESAAPSGAGEVDRITSTYSAFNRLVFRAEVSRPGALVLSVPYSRQWHALVDSHETIVEQSPRNQQMVTLTPGVHQVDFRFHSPASLVGVLMSGAMVLLIAFYCARRAPPGWVRAAAMVAAVAGPTGAFLIWKHSLYTGADLGTRYVWVSKPG